MAQQTCKSELYLLLFSCFYSHFLSESTSDGLQIGNILKYGFLILFLSFHQKRLFFFNEFYIKVYLMTVSVPQMQEKHRNYTGASLTVYYLLLILPDRFKWTFLTHSLDVYCHHYMRKLGRVSLGGFFCAISTLDKIAHILEGY